jgi:hypothetical protein
MEGDYKWRREVGKYRKVRSVLKFLLVTARSGAAF